MAKGLEQHAIGGQAVIEGVMMRSPRYWALAVRRPDGTIHTESHPIATGRRWARWAFLRGAAALGQATSIAMRALAISARESSGSDEEITKRDIAVSLTFAAGFFIALFIVLPALLVRGGAEQPVTRNLVEGLVRIGIFFGYVLVISLMRDVSRIFGYHGAEHKVIAAVEAGEPATPDAIRPFSTVHVRCGTNFLFLVMLVAVVVFAFVGRDPWWWRVGSRILLLPVVAAVSFELLRLAARLRRNLIVRVVTWPGLALQRITTREPGEDQVEVAIAAMEELRSREDPTPPEPPSEAA